jgi:hypothetical protein
MKGEGDLSVARVRCSRCAAEAFAVAGPDLGPCPICSGSREVVETFLDRRAGQDRRGPRRLQRVWDMDPRSWFDRRRA